MIMELPNALRDELTTYMNIKLIKSLKIFSGCSNLCLKEVAKRLEKKSTLPVKR